MNSLLFIILIIFIIILIILSKNIFTQNAQNVSPFDLNVSEDEIYEHVKNLIDNKQYDAAFKMAKKYQKLLFFVGFNRCCRHYVISEDPLLLKRQGKRL